MSFFNDFSSLANGLLFSFNAIISFSSLYCSGSSFSRPSTSALTAFYLFRFYSFYFADCIFPRIQFMTLPRSFPFDILSCSKLIFFSMASCRRQLLRNCSKAWAQSSICYEVRLTGRSSMRSIQSVSASTSDLWGALELSRRDCYILDCALDYYILVGYSEGKCIGFSLTIDRSRFYYQLLRLTGITTQLFYPLFFFMRLTSRASSLSLCWISSFSLFIYSAALPPSSSVPGTKERSIFLLSLFVISFLSSKTALPPPLFSAFLKQQKHSLILSLSLSIIAAEGSSVYMYQSTILWHSQIQYLSSSSFVSSPFSSAISALSCAFSFFSLAIMTPGSTVSFLRRSFLMSATLMANLQVAMLSSMSSSLGLMVAIMRVLQLPPSESLRTIVMSESRQDTCTFSPLAFWFSWMMTLSRQCSPRLMLMAYFYSSPSTPVCLILSEPERSTKCTEATVFMSLPVLEDSMLMMKMQCERVDSSFLGVLLTTLLVSPMKRQFNASYSVWQWKLCRLLSCSSPLAPYLGYTLGRSYSFFVTFSTARRSQPILWYIWRQLMFTLMFSLRALHQLKMQLRVRGINPRSSQLPDPPVIVKVLPEPV